MTQEHPITPPTELVLQWHTEADNQLGPYYDYIATQAARWGADQELQACINWLHENDWKAVYKHLRAARRPPSLREQALEALGGLEKRCDLQCNLAAIRRALETLPS